MKSFFASMSGRVFLILLLGITASAALTWWLAFGERQRAIGQFRQFHTVERVEQLILALDAIPAGSRDAYLRIANRPNLRAEVPSAATGAMAEPERTGESEFGSALQLHLGDNYHVAPLAAKPPMCGQARRTSLFGAGPPHMVCERITVSLHDHSLLRLTVLPSRNPPPQPYRDLIANLALFWCSIGVLAFFVARMTMRPLKQLAQAANDLGKDINHPPLQVSGASEIRQASAAFNAMQARIRQYIGQRTQMLAAITHDLQTPLTRLRLRLEKVTDAELRDKLADDLLAMQDMVREGLDLARSMDSAEAMQAVDLDSVLDSVCADAAEAGQAVTLQGRVGMAVMARPAALRRCLINLIDNAVKYGQYARVTVERSGGEGGSALALIRIRDGGEGIPAEQLARVFEPFYRIETSRSRQSGGTGLGLTIARNIAEQHGGSLTLANHADGGLEVSLCLPHQILR